MPRWKGKADVEMDAERKQIVAEMAAHYLPLKQHVTCGAPVGYRIGNRASNNAWGGDSRPPPPPLTDKELRRGQIMAPVPYDVPRLARSPELIAAGDALAAMYREMGVLGGGGGTLFGLSIDHVLHSIVGTPTVDGHSSPRRTVAGLEQPKMALIEVACMVHGSKPR